MEHTAQALRDIIDDAQTVHVMASWQPNLSKNSDNNTVLVSSSDSEQLAADVQSCFKLQVLACAATGEVIGKKRCD